MVCYNDFLLEFNDPFMPKLEEVYKRLEKNKKKRRDINKAYRDELAGNQHYQELTEQLKTLREQKKSIETDVKSTISDYQELDDLRLEIQTDKEVLSDIALNMYVKQEPVEIIDEYDNKWYPVFSVAFKKE